MDTLRRRWVSVLVGVVVAAGLAGCGVVDVRPGPVAEATPSLPAQPGRAVTVDPAAVRWAREVLPTVAVETFPGRDSTYERDLFGQPWSDAAVGIPLARNGCDTRNDILKRDAQPATVRVKAGTRGCKVTGGVWISPYTGRRYAATSLVQIDHIVALSRSWAAGAKAWSDERRLAFANDPDNLLAVDGASNQSKGDKGPGAWRPRRPFQCAYAVHYLRATVKYRLPITGSDRSALRSMLDSCPR
ncbi:MAG TPA: HNH endonuclease family protein [Cryptosporangiaceae bacterium]|nr:HNH endonuclease family protein [Cryptosporangiaceae bacterium]